MESCSPKTVLHFVAQDRVGISASKQCKSVHQFLAMAPIPAKLSYMKVFGITLAAALSMTAIDHPLSCVELWGGVASVAGAAGDRGLEAVAMDRVPGVTDAHGSATEDLVSKEGFVRALSTVHRLKARRVVMDGTCLQQLGVHEKDPATPWWQQFLWASKGRKSDGYRCCILICAGHADWCSPSPGATCAKHDVPLQTNR